MVAAIAVVIATAGVCLVPAIRQLDNSSRIKTHVL